MIIQRRRPTQKQIAARAGVSTTTVCRVLNPYETNPERWASALTINQIREIADQVGYNYNGYSPSQSRSRFIATMLPTTDDYVVSAIHSGIDQVATYNQLTSIMVCTMDGLRPRSDRVLNLMDGTVDGLILADAQLDDELLDMIQAQQVPFTLVHRRHPDYVSVHADDWAAGNLAAKHLINLGRKNLAFIGGRSQDSTGKDRIDGFMAAIQEAGLALPQVIETDHFVESGQQATQMLLEHNPIPDAIFAAHDWAALGSLGILRERGLSVPEDVAVIGCYETPLAQAADLTSIRIDLKQMGYRACQLLIDTIDNRPVTSETLPVGITVRGSTNPDRFSVS